MVLIHRWIYISDENTDSLAVVDRRTRYRRLPNVNATPRSRTSLRAGATVRSARGTGIESEVPMDWTDALKVSTLVLGDR